MTLLWFCQSCRFCYSAVAVKSISCQCDLTDCLTSKILEVHFKKSLYLDRKYFYLNIKSGPNIHLLLPTEIANECQCDLLLHGKVYQISRSKIQKRYRSLVATIDCNEDSYCPPWGCSNCNGELQSQRRPLLWYFLIFFKKIEQQ